MIKTALKSLREAQLDHLVSDAIYHHSYRSCPIKTVLGKSKFKSQNDYGIWIWHESQDFIIPLEQLDFEPEAGDTIECEGKRYEVLAPANEPVWRWSDAERTAMRIHTKYMGRW